MTTNQENRRSDVIRCEFCGEDYSVTYRRCPFCDDKAGVPMEPRSRSKKGGRRVAPTNKRGGGYGGALRPVQVIGIALSIILIIAAIYIVYSVLSPLFAGDKSGDVSSDVSVSQSDVSTPDVSSPDVSTPDVSTPDVSVPDVSVPDPSTSSGVVAPVVKATGVKLSKSDVTAGANERFTLKATVTPANSDDTVVWSSSDETVAKVDQNGVVTNVNTASQQKNATITVKVGDVSASCLVRCKGGSTGSAPSGNQPSVQPSTQPSGTATAMNASGVFNTGNANIRSGPGTNHAPQDSSVLNAEVKVLEETADGWYKITYSGKGGAATTGYIIKSAVTLK